MKLKITVHSVAYEVDVEVLDASDEMIHTVPIPCPPASAGESSHAGIHSSSSAAPGPGLSPPGSPCGAVGPPSGPIPASAAPTHAASGSGSVTSPIAGTVLEVKCQPGEDVQRGQVLMIIEAMKMETAIAAPVSGSVICLHAAAGDTVRENQNLVDIEG